MPLMPSTSASFRLAVSLAASARAVFYRVHRRPLRIGASISDVHPEFISAGTLGCFVTDRKSPHYPSMLSNNHVIAGENATPVGSPILQPGTLDGGADPADLVGELHRLIKLKKTRANFVDAAIAALYDDVPHDLTTIGSLGSLSGQGDVAALPEKATVHKVGRTTGQTRGRITAFDFRRSSAGSPDGGGMGGAAAGVRPTGRGHGTPRVRVGSAPGLGTLRRRTQGSWRALRGPTTPGNSARIS